jgi:malate dehydrogenase (oxaloacetate-decarboxylating)(NADP+)
MPVGTTRVAEFMFDKGLAKVERPADIRAWIEEQLYKPQYPDIGA